MLRILERERVHDPAVCAGPLLRGACSPAWTTERMKRSNKTSGLDKVVPYQDCAVRDLAVLFLHLLVTVARLAGPGGARSVVAESVLVKQQLLILNRVPEAFTESPLR